MDRHLVAVEIRVERGADQRVNLKRFAFDEHRLESLDAEAVQRGGAVEQNRVIFDDLFEDVPNDGILLFDQFFRLLDRGAMAALFQPVIDERLEKFERHLLRQAALMQLEIGTNHDDRTARVVDTLTEQVLTEAALLAFERIGKRFERAVISAAQDTSATSVVEQRIDGFLQHALFIAHNHVRSMKLHQLLQAVVAVDNAAIEIVKIRSGETAAIERDQGTSSGGMTGSTSRIIHSGLLPDFGSFRRRAGAWRTSASSAAKFPSSSFREYLRSGIRHRSFSAAL